MPYKDPANKKAHNEKYRADNKEKIKNKKKEYYERNKEDINTKNRERREKNKERNNENNKEYHKDRKQHAIDSISVGEIIDKNKWDIILKAFLNLSRRNDIKTPVSLESIPVESSSLLSKKVKLSNESIQNLESIDDKSLEFPSGKYKFEPMGGDMHIVQDLDKDFMIDFNEGSINLFLKSTKELVKIKRSFILDVNRIFYN
jgi:hypothetical protein